MLAKDVLVFNETIMVTEYKIRSAEWIADQMKRFVIEAPLIAVKQKCGQFVIVRLKEGGERIPLTIVGSDMDSGRITLIVQGVGKTTREMNLLEAGDSILDVVGPLGQPTEIRNYGTAVTIGGGVGTAIAYPSTIALRDAGNYTISIIGSRNRDLVILEKELQQVAHELYVTTDDGSYGFHGLVTDQLRLLIEGQRKIDFVYAVGPIPMMKAVADVTRHYGIHTVVSLNPIMVDGTGMCGGCRATVDNKTVFVCVDGPEFDAHKVDFDLLAKRNKAYKPSERLSLEKLKTEIGSDKKSLCKVMP
jgi:ferredoxin--NADP+ reductase